MYNSLVLYYLSRIHTLISKEITNVLSWWVRYGMIWILWMFESTWNIYSIDSITFLMNKIEFLTQQFLLYESIDKCGELNLFSNDVLVLPIVRYCRSVGTRLLWRVFVCNESCKKKIIQSFTWSVNKNNVEYWKIDWTC